MKINLLTVCTDVYPMSYARKLITRFKQLTDLEVEAFCITDRPDEISDIATCIERPFKTQGWWNKMFCYSKDLIPEGWNVYLDLDMILCENFDEEILYAIKKQSKVASFTDAIKWCNNSYNSSFVVFRTGKMHNIYEIWADQHKDLVNYQGGDQVWTGRVLEALEEKVLYLDKKFPLSKQSLKFQFGTIENSMIRVPLVKPEGVKIIDCNGKPKPDQITGIDYITEAWHNI